MLKGRKRIVIVALVVLAAAGAAGFAGSRFGLFDRLDHARSEWSLRSRVKSLWDARVAGDLEKSNSFVIASCKPRATLGKAVRFLGYEVKQVDINDEVAEVSLAVDTRIDFPGLPAKMPGQGPQLIRQRWVRAGSTWYWDPGDGYAVDPALLMKPVAGDASQGGTPGRGGRD
jgi:hypothetical protein